jgi:hypothetical protein
MKCIFANIKPSHLMRSKFIEHSCLRLKWGKVIFVIPFTYWNKYIPCDPFLSLNNFSFMKKKIPIRITPHTEGQEKILMRKKKKPWESQKGMRAQETQMLGGMPKSLEKMTSKIKWVCPNIVKKKEATNQRKAAKENMNDVKSQTVDSNPQSLKPWNTLWALWILSFIAKNHSLRYVPVEVFSNQASKQSRTINNALKMQRILFHKIHDIKNKLLIIIHADKNECLKRDKLFFLKQNLELFLEPFTLKTKRSSHDIFSPKDLFCQTQE